ncbi:MAG: hypothetical protein HY043_07950 [Verrucomicrobia bacterium]|nr:hypothetical protein [Verrucomicrobiota bacterium]
MSNQSKPAIYFRRIGIVTVIALAAFGAGARFYYNFCNRPRQTPEWVAARLDTTIERGLNYLHSMSAFTKLYADGGESPVHHFLIEEILRHQEHEGLRFQLALARKTNAADEAWRKYYGLPGWPRDELTDEDRRQIKFFVADVKNLYTAWILNALYPDWTQLPPWAHDLIYVQPERLPRSSDLAHARFALYLLKQLWPQNAQRLGVDDLVARIDSRLATIHRWAPRCSDSYQLRLATWLLLKGRVPISQRWIERTLISQNSDGGWTWIPSCGRVGREMFGADSFSDVSAPHTTFLALLTLTLYREQMRAAGTYPMGARN